MVEKHVAENVVLVEAFFVVDSGLVAAVLQDRKLTTSEATSIYTTSPGACVGTCSIQRYR